MELPSAPFEQPKEGQDSVALYHIYLLFSLLKLGMEGRQSDEMLSITGHKKLCSSAA
jgi:hypothetical protein